MLVSDVNAKLRIGKVVQHGLVRRIALLRHVVVEALHHVRDCHRRARGLERLLRRLRVHNSVVVAIAIANEETKVRRQNALWGLATLQVQSSGQRWR